MTTTELWVDWVLLSGIVLMVIACLFTRQLFKAIVLYVSLGLLVTLAWARLGAWDVAIAEAAMGAGLTGALLLVAWRKLSAASALQSSQTAQSQKLDGQRSKGVSDV